MEAVVAPLSVYGEGPGEWSMPERPPVPAMLDELDAAYAQLLEFREPVPAPDRSRLEAVAQDFRWYAERLGPARWEQPPKPGRWSFADNLWHIVGQTGEALRMFREGSVPDGDGEVVYFIDHGKEHVGQAAEIFAIFEYSSEC
jgi:hypothetical protein